MHVINTCRDREENVTVVILKKVNEKQR